MKHEAASEVFVKREEKCEAAKMRKRPSTMSDSFSPAAAGNDNDLETDSGAAEDVDMDAEK